MPDPAGRRPGARRPAQAGPRRGPGPAGGGRHRRGPGRRPGRRPARRDPRLRPRLHGLVSLAAATPAALVLARRVAAPPTAVAAPAATPAVAAAPAVVEAPAVHDDARAILDAQPHLILLTDVDGRILRAFGRAGRFRQRGPGRRRPDRAGRRGGRPAAARGPGPGRGRRLRLPRLPPGGNRRGLAGARRRPAVARPRLPTVRGAPEGELRAGGDRRLPAARAGARKPDRGDANARQAPSLPVRKFIGNMANIKGLFEALEPAAGCTKVT